LRAALISSTIDAGGSLALQPGRWGFFRAQKRGKIKAMQFDLQNGALL